jgi:hypothetical protein
MRRAGYVVVVAAMLGSCTGGARSTATLDTATWQSEDVPTLDLVLRYPPQWHVQEFDEQVGHVGFSGVGILNVDERLQHPSYSNGETTGWDMRRMSSDALAISVEHVAESLGRPDVRADTPMPLSIDDAKAAPYRNPAGRGHEVTLPFRLAGRLDVIRVWYGPSVDAHDREIAAELVAAIRPQVTD